MDSLLEKYSKRLSYSEGVYGKYHAGETLNESKKLVIAKVLDNTASFLNEAFSNSVGTQRADMGLFKKFTLDLTTVALPNLIANDLVIVHPMSAMSGYIQYIQFTAGSNKGATAQGKVFNDPFRLQGTVDADYTGDRVAEVVTISAEDSTGRLAWAPVVAGSVSLVDAESGASITLVDAETGAVSFSGVSGSARVRYVYDNKIIPQHDLPTFNAKMVGMSLEAKARRIAIYYSQMAAFQAKTEMGMDLGKVLATQACGELSYEIDTEVTDLLIANAEVRSELTFNKTLPVGVGKLEHYAGFSEIVEKASQVIYDKTRKHAANYMLIASNIKPVISLIPGWKEAPKGKINGPYFAGTLNGVKVYVTPNITPGKFVCGFNGDDMVTSAAVYAPYMAIVPTALLSTPDGGNAQGFSTLYDLKLLNADLLVAGTVVELPQVVEVHSN